MALSPSPRAGPNEGSRQRQSRNPEPLLASVGGTPHLRDSAPLSVTESSLSSKIQRLDTTEAGEGDRVDIFARRPERSLVTKPLGLLLDLVGAEHALNDANTLLHFLSR